MLGLKLVRLMKIEKAFRINSFKIYPVYIILKCIAFLIGDRSKVAVLQSNHQTSYHPPPRQDASGLPLSVGVRPPAPRHINESSIKLKDHTKPPTHYFTTTATDAFQQLENTGE